MRGDAGFREETAKDANTPVYLVALELRCSIGNTDSESVCLASGGEWTPAVYATNFDRDIEFNGVTYLAIGGFLGVDTITETTSLEIGSVNLALSGVDRGFVAMLLQKNYIDKPVTIYRAMLDSAGLPAHVIEVYRGYIDEPAIQDSLQDATVTVTVRHHFADFEKRSGRRTNNAEHQFYFPGDTSMSHADEGLAELPWGKAKS